MSIEGTSARASWVVTWYHGEFRFDIGILSTRQETVLSDEQFIKLVRSEIHFWVSIEMWSRCSLEFIATLAFLQHNFTIIYEKSIELQLSLYPVSKNEWFPRQIIESEMIFLKVWTYFHL